MSDSYFQIVLMLINVGFEVLTLLNPAKMCDVNSTESCKSQKLQLLYGKHTYWSSSITMCFESEEVQNYTKCACDVSAGTTEVLLLTISVKIE